MIFGAAAGHELEQVPHPVDEGGCVARDVVSRLDKDQSGDEGGCVARDVDEWNVNWLFTKAVIGLYDSILHEGCK